MSVREQTPAHRARVAVQAIGEQLRADAAVLPESAEGLSKYEIGLRERLVSGDANSTPNQHQIAFVLRYTRGGRQGFLDHIKRAMLNGDPDARQWWLVYGDLLPAQQSRVDLDDVCAAAGVTPDRIMAVVVSAAMRQGADMADYIAAVNHPEIVRKTVKSALRIGGDHALIAQKDREMLLQHAKFMPVRGGHRTNINVNANAQADAKAAAAAQPSVPTFSESLSAPMHAQASVQRQVSDRPPIDVGREPE